MVAISKAPVIASHSGCTGVNPQPATRRTNSCEAPFHGGVIQIVAVWRIPQVAGLRGTGQTPLCREHGHERWRFGAASKHRRGASGGRWLKSTAGTAGEFKDFVDHIDHAVRVAVMDHVASAAIRRRRRRFPVSRTTPTRST